MVVVYLDFAEGTAVPWTCSANTYVRHEAVAFPVRHDGMVGTVNDTRIPELVSEYADVSSDIPELVSEYANTCDGTDTTER